MSATVREVAESVSNTSIAANGANAETEKGRKVVEEAVQGVQHLAGQIESTAEVIVQLEKNSENINTVLYVIKGIADAEEQSVVTEDMNRNIVRISDMTTQNASGAEQTSQAGQEVAHMASELQGLVRQFRVKKEAV